MNEAIFSQGSLHSCLRQVGQECLSCNQVLRHLFPKTCPQARIFRPGSAGSLGSEVAEVSGFAFCSVEHWWWCVAGSLSHFATYIGVVHMMHRGSSRGVVSQIVSSQPHLRKSSLVWYYLAILAVVVVVAIWHEWWL
jgi:hypothetical protein